MSLSRYAKRRDANERAIIEGLRQAGAAVWQLDTPADLLVGHLGRLRTLEVKDGSLPPSRRALTPLEASYAATCEERNLPHHVVTSVEDALAVVLNTNGET